MFVFILEHTGVLFHSDLFLTAELNKFGAIKFLGRKTEIEIVGTVSYQRRRAFLPERKQQEEENTKVPRLFECHKQHLPPAALRQADIVSGKWNEEVLQVSDDSADGLVRCASDEAARTNVLTKSDCTVNCCQLDNFIAK